MKRRGKGDGIRTSCDHLHFRHSVVLRAVTGPLLGYLDRPVSQNTISNRSSRDVSRSVRSPFHLPFHLHLVPFLFRRYPRVRRSAHLLAADKLVTRQVGRLKVTVGSGFFRGASGNGGDRGHATALPRAGDRRVSSIKRLFEQLLLQKHRLLKIGDIRVHGVGGQITRARCIRHAILVILRARYPFVVRIISVYLFTGKSGTRAAESLLLLLLLQLLLVLLLLLMMMMNRGYFRRTENQRALVMIFLAPLQLQCERITVARLAGIVSARAVLFLARAIALRRAIPSTGRRLIRLPCLRVLDHGARRNVDRVRVGRGNGGGLRRGNNARPLVMIVGRMTMPVAMVLVRRGIYRLAIRLRYSFVYVLRFAPHVIRVRFCQSDGGGGGRPSPSPALAAPSPSAPLAATRLRLSAHAEALHLLRAILHRVLHPLLLFTALVIRVPSRRRAVSTTTTTTTATPSLLRALRGTGGRGGVTRNGWPQRGPVLLRVFGTLFRLLLLLSDQLLDQTVLIGGYVIRREQRRALKIRKDGFVDS